MRSRLTLLVARTLAALLALAGTVGAGATTVLPLDVDQMVAGAREIAHVRCVDNRAVSDPLVGVATITTFVVLDRAKGAASPLLSIRQAGGTLDGRVVDYRVPHFAVGAEYVLFMPAPSSAGLASPVGLSQGVFGVYPSRLGKEVGNGRSFGELLPGSAAAAAAGSAAARAQSAAPASTRMALGDFMSLLRAKAGTK